MKELNKLTQRLFAEGYTKDRHPDYVDDWTYQSEFYGGFEYTGILRLLLSEIEGEVNHDTR